MMKKVHRNRHFQSESSRLILLQKQSSKEHQDNLEFFSEGKLSFNPS